MDPDEGFRSRSEWADMGRLLVGSLSNPAQRPLYPSTEVVMGVPPSLARGRELVRLMEQELARLQANPDACDPAVPGLAAYVDELAGIIDSLPPALSAEASDEVKRQMQSMSLRVIAEAAWWMLKEMLYKSGRDD